MYHVICHGPGKLLFFTAGQDFVLYSLLDRGRRKKQMIGLGTIINSVSIAAGGLIGHFTGKLFQQEQRDSLNKACGTVSCAGGLSAVEFLRNLKVR